MSEMKHTPGPWLIRATELFDAKGGIICRVDGNMFSPNQQDHANAARIVACVNALEGLSDEYIKRLPEIIEEGVVARQQREDLRNALMDIRFHPNWQEIGIAFSNVPNSLLSEMFGPVDSILERIPAEGGQP